MRIEFLADHINSREIIASWFMKEWGERYPERDLACWAETQTYLNKGKLPLTLVAIEGNEIVGTVCLRADGMTSHKEWQAWLSYLVVPEAHRGKGIGKALVKKAEAIASELNINELHLFTRLGNPTLYSALGWGMIGKEEYRGGTVSVMGKTIKPMFSHNPFYLATFFKSHLCVTTAAAATVVIGMAYLRNKIK